MGRPATLNPAGNAEPVTSSNSGNPSEMTIGPFARTGTFVIVALANATRVRSGDCGTWGRAARPLLTLCRSGLSERFPHRRPARRLAKNQRSLANLLHSAGDRIAQ